MGDLISTNHYKCQNTQPAKAEEISALVEFSLKDEFSSQILELLAKSVFLFLFAEHIENRLALATYSRCKYLVLIGVCIYVGVGGCIYVWVNGYGGPGESNRQIILKYLEIESR